MVLSIVELSHGLVHVERSHLTARQVLQELLRGRGGGQNVLEILQSGHVLSSLSAGLSLAVVLTLHCRLISTW